MADVSSQDRDAQLPLLPAAFLPSPFFCLPPSANWDWATSFLLMLSFWWEDLVPYSASALEQPAEGGRHRQREENARRLGRGVHSCTW